MGCLTNPPRLDLGAELKYICAEGDMDNSQRSCSTSRLFICFATGNPRVHSMLTYCQPPQQQEQNAHGAIRRRRRKGGNLYNCNFCGSIVRANASR